MNTSTPAPAKMRILVIDDDPVIVECLVAMIDTEYIVDSARNTIKAVELLMSHNYDVLITDYNMPGMTGAEICRLMHRQQQSCKTVVITGAVDVEAIKEAAGADTLLRKPIRRTHLLMLLHGLDMERVHA